MSKNANTALLPKKLRKVCTSRISPLSGAFCKADALRNSLARTGKLNCFSNSTPILMSRRERIHSRLASVIRATTAAIVMTTSVEKRRELTKGIARGEC